MHLAHRLQQSSGASRSFTFSVNRTNGDNSFDLMPRGDDEQDVFAVENPPGELAQSCCSGENKLSLSFWNLKYLLPLSPLPLPLSSKKDS